MHFLIISPSLIYFISGFSTTLYSDSSTNIFVELIWDTDSQNMVWEFLEVVVC